MKLSRIVDKEVDQNEIEAKYLWNFLYQPSQRVNLSTFNIDYFVKPQTSILNHLTIVEKKIFGLKSGVRTLSKKVLEFFISDEFFNIKILDTYRIQSCIRHCFASCFYDDSIFIFESEYNTRNKEEIIGCRARRYLVSQDKWILLTGLPLYSYSCIGFKQKIIITSICPFLIIYDIILDSYSYHSLISCDATRQIMLKKSGKLYSFAKLPNYYKIYCWDDALSNWAFVCNYKDDIFGICSFPYACNNGMIYYFSEPHYYEFSLDTFIRRELSLT